MASKALKKTGTADRYRQAELAKIHIAKKDLCLDGDTYRAMLLEVGGAESAADLDAEGRRKVLDHLKTCGFKGKKAQEYPGRPRNIAVPGRQELLEKIEACLASRGLPWSYAVGMAKRICKKEALELCGPCDLLKIVAAFGYDAKRKGIRK